MLADEDLTIFSQEFRLCLALTQRQALTHTHENMQ